jgi:hypothetical protein
MSNKKFNEIISKMRELGYDELANTFKKGISSPLSYNESIHIAMFLNTHYALNKIRPTLEYFGWLKDKNAMKHLNHIYWNVYQYNNKAFLRDCRELMIIS